MEPDTLTMQLQRARGQGAALISISTADQPALQDVVCRAVSEDDDACIGWDAIRGPYPVNEAGQAALQAVLGQMDPAMATDFPAFASMLREKPPENAVVTIHNAHRLMQDSNASAVTRCIQGIQNLRDPLTAVGSTLVLFAPAWASPAELGSDVLELDDPLPDDAERREMAQRILADTAEQQDGFEYDDDDVNRAERATRGLSRYACEQTVSLALRRAGLDEERLRARFRSAINAAPGLTYLPNRVAPEDIGGLDNFKQFAELVANGRQVPTSSSDWTRSRRCSAAPAPTAPASARTPSA
jgi:hypothetical protein